MQPAGESEGVNATICLEHLRALAHEDVCLTKTTGYWTYEVCSGRHVSQFHVERNEGVRPEQPIYLGHYSNETAGYATELSPYRQFYVDGSVCDLTGLRRTATVTYHCREGSADVLGVVMEPSSCNYEFTVFSDRLCTSVQQEPAKIHCAPLVPRAHPPPPSPSEALTVGQVWTGSYTCQGEQWFCMRIYSTREDVDHTEFYGLLSFQHANGDGLFLVRGTYVHGTDVVSIQPGPWVSRPSAGFSTVTMEATLNLQRSRLNGVVVECNFGPFTLNLEEQGDVTVEYLMEAALRDVVNGRQPSAVQQAVQLAWRFAANEEQEPSSGAPTLQLAGFEDLIRSQLGEMADSITFEVGQKDEHRLAQFF